jgi:hypothetical protein
VSASAFAGAAWSTLTGCSKEKETKVQEIKFELGKNIVDTAKSSGVPQFESDDVNGSISYSVAGFSTEIPARFAKPGYEIVWRPLFAFTMYTNRRRDPSLAVHKASLQLKNHLTSHAAAQAFVEQTVAQFAKGKWQRYHDPVWDVLLTGRSSMLDEAGHIATTVMTIDPAYNVPPVDWPALAKSGPIWRWVGDGVLASLTIGFTERETSAAPQYSMDLEFELLDVYTKQLAENGDQKRKEGDAKGWNSTAKYEAAKKERAELNKRLIANAIKRGDQVVSR